MSNVQIKDYGLICLNNADKNNSCHLFINGFMSDELEKAKELFFGQDVEVEDLKIILQALILLAYSNSLAKICKNLYKDKKGV